MEFTCIVVVNITDKLQKILEIIVIVLYLGQMFEISYRKLEPIYIEQ